MKKTLLTTMIVCVLACACLFVLASCGEEAPPTTPQTNGSGTGDDLFLEAKERG